MNKTYTEFISFYITNVCGLSCDNCASYNNYVLKGHYDWETAKDKVFEWGKLLDVRQITIIGGEPFLHPDIDNWVLGIRSAFPDTKDIRILTGLKGHALLKYKSKILKWLEIGVIVQMSVHDYNWWTESAENAREILKNLEYRESPGINGGTPLKTIDYFNPNGQLLYSILEQWEFFPNSTKEIKDGVIYLHNNDPEKSYKACLCYDCHYIVDGLLYKCVMTGIAKMLADQVPLDTRSKELLSQVKGLDPFVDVFEEFTTAIPQCSLCNDKLNAVIPIWPLSIKKPKLPHV
jgi:hypothetical protein